MRKFILILIFFSFHLLLFSLSVENGGSSIKGKVTDQSGNALSGAAITIENTYLGVHSSEDGTYVITNLKDGKYVLKCSFIGYESQVKEVDLKNEAIINISLKSTSFITDEITVSAIRAGEHTPLAYSVVSDDQLRKQNYGVDLPFLLSLTPSLVETSEAGNGVGYTSQRIRGTDGNRINITIDGIPLNEPESQQVFWVDLPDLASSVDNIQVQRGVGTSSNGSGAFGGTVSIQTDSPDKEPFAEVQTSYGSFNTRRNMVAAGTGMISDRFALQMRYSELKSDGYIDRTSSNLHSTYISGIYQTGRSKLKANIIIGEEHTGISWWGVPKDSLETNRRYNPAGEYTDANGILQHYDNESDNYNQNHYQLFYSLKLSDYLSFNSALHYTRGKGYYEEYRENQPLSDYGLSPFNMGGDLITETDLIRRKWLSTHFYGLIYSLKYKNNKIEAVIGGGINMYNGNHSGNIIWMRNAGNTEKDFQWFLNESEKDEINIYGKMNYNLTDKISVYGDLQYRHIYYSLMGPDDDFKDITQDHRYDFINPKTGIFYSITPNQDAYLSFSVANREPTRTDFTEASGDASATPKAETLFDYELGYKFRTGKSSFGVNLYLMDYKDQLVPTGELSNVGYSIMTNVSRSYRAGVEFMFAVKPVSIFEWNMNLTLSRNKISDFTEYYTDYNTTDWSEAYRNKDLGNVDIAYSPSVTGSSDISFKVLKNTDIHFISKYVGKQYFDNTINDDRMINPYFVNNIRFDFQPAVKNIKGLNLQLLVNNIFNNVYESNAYGGNWYEDGAEKTWSYFFPQAGINYLVKLGLKF
jgi:iron complex outermembrane recepter protein